ncbi:Gfo/Idh/MocA family protein [Aliagarivorans taiwanensis]|uniref:Gfo/Idh/MocA family protein n=1 Tax=Aliagarivorans taiwanensis TaxID=561966 RepID=UPI0004177B25|nr:Gfo/Idh/MocA family oxidoreductase [Aliagarivorans taiwanensis]
MTTFNWGIIAPGRIARSFAEGLRVVEGATLLGVASSNVQRATAFAKEYGAERTYDSYQAMAQDPDIDAIYIANPHRFHFETAELCLKAGKPVLCEKPLTVSAGQTEALIALAREHKVFLMEALWSRFLPVWQQVKRWLDEGVIGEVSMIQSSFGFDVPRDPGDRMLNRDLAGGVLLDMGVYNVALSQFVMGRDPESISVDGIVGETGVDEQTSMTLNYGGPVSQFTCSFQVKLNNDMIIYGSKGKITVHDMFWSCHSATLSLLNGEQQQFDGPFQSSGFEYQAMEVMRCLKEGKLQSDTIPWLDTLGNMQVMEQALNKLGVHYPFLDN